jgi:glycosyltransferase involved in cell wall biosynthesis
MLPANSEKHPPRVSVVMTSYNQADLLAEAIQSVLEQTYQDFEILVVDDGSRDHTLEMVASLRNQRPDKLFLFTHPGHVNKGIVSTYELGMSKARGEYVAFLEQDDSWPSNYLMQKVDILSTHPQVGVVFSPYKLVGKGAFGLDMIFRQWLLQFAIVKKKPFNNFANLLQSNNVATFSCFVTRKKLLGRMPAANSSIAAYDWWVLVHLSIESLFYYDETCATCWRWSPSSVIGQQTFTVHRDRGTEYMESMYVQIDKDIDHLDAFKKRTFLKCKENFAYFLVFYRKPSVLRFLRFFKKSPMWALASLASLIINFVKFEHLKPK